MKYGYFSLFTLMFASLPGNFFKDFKIIENLSNTFSVFVFIIGLQSNYMCSER